MDRITSRPDRRNIRRAPPRGAALTEVAALLVLVLVLCIGSVRVIGRQNRCRLDSANDSIRDVRNYLAFYWDRENCCARAIRPPIGRPFNQCMYPDYID